MSSDAIDDPASKEGPRPGFLRVHFGLTGEFVNLSVEDPKIVERVILSRNAG